MFILTKLLKPNWPVIIHKIPLILWFLLIHSFETLINTNESLILQMYSLDYQKCKYLEITEPQLR